jgi:hypothetical protein
MRFVITYTDYKCQEIHNLNINHIFNVKSTDQLKSSSLSKYKPIIETPNKLTRYYDIGTNIHKYTDGNGNTNYRINLISLMNSDNKYNRNRKLNNICDSLFVNILQSDIKDHKLTVHLDEDVLKKYETAKIPNDDIYIQIYDKHGVFGRIYY